MFSPSFTGTTIIFFELIMLLLNFRSQIAAQNYIYFLYLQNFPLFFIENEREIVSLLAS